MTLLDTRNEPVREMRMEPANRTTALISVIERLATNQATDVDKLQKMIELQERLLDRQAQDEFRISMSEAQSEMRSVAKDAYNPQTRSRFASHEALDDALRPVYTKYGFSQSFDTADSPLPEHVRVVCEVSHRGGFTRPYHIDIPADGKGAKGGDVMTKTHATVSAVSYGMRTLNRMVWNVATGEGDDDGNRASKAAPKPDAPAGYADWWKRLEDAAKDGLPMMTTFWKESDAKFRDYTFQHNRAAHETLKVSAANVTAKTKGAK